MNNDDIQKELIEYAEGTLSAERKKEIESILANSRELREEAELLITAFTELQLEGGISVPEHYFQNFLPKLREKLDHGAGYSLWTIPRFVDSVMRPATALLIIVSIYGLYRSFQPETDHSPIYALVSEFEQNEISSIIEESAPFTVNNFESIAETRLPGELFGIDPSNYQTENEVFTLLEDQEAEKVIERIQRTVAQ